MIQRQVAYEWKMLTHQKGDQTRMVFAAWGNYLGASERRRPFSETFPPDEFQEMCTEALADLERDMRREYDVLHAYFKPKDEYRNGGTDGEQH
jgi:hypothetical protein